MPISTLSNQVIAIANEQDKAITSLQLQKVMYFTLKIALRTHLLPLSTIEKLYDEPFLVWRYGPVVKSVYSKYQIFGSERIVESTNKCEELSNVDVTISELLDFNPFDLISITHTEPIWKNNKHKLNGWRSDVEYSLENIKV